MKDWRRPIPGYDGYLADEFGGIWSAFTNWRGYGTRQLKQDLGTDGYMRVKLMRDGKRIHKTVHVLVCQAFHGEPKLGQEVCHKDGNKLNNKSRNLKWGTRKQNADDREVHGRTARGKNNGAFTHPELRPKGERNGQSKLTEAQVREIRRLHGEGMGYRRLGQMFEVQRNTIRYIIIGRTWAHVD